MLIDHLLRFPDEATAMSSLPAHVSEGIEPGALLLAPARLRDPSQVIGKGDE